MWFFLNLHLQQVLGAGAFASGVALLPMTALIVLGMRSSVRLPQRRRFAKRPRRTRQRKSN
jgi:hypothetical protein